MAAAGAPESYVVVSPVRNEENYVEKTIESVLAQSVRPAEWILVDDGSSDQTASIIQRYLGEHSWMRLLRRSDRGFPLLGEGVVEAFYEGFECVEKRDWSFVVKLDCDLSFDSDFFERILAAFARDRRLGIAGGTTYVPEASRLHEERMPRFHPFGGARVYRRPCFEEIGGLPKTLGWDVLDLVRAQMRGWTTSRLTDAKIVHHRRMSSRRGLWEGKLRTGRLFYVTGYHPLFLVARSTYRLKERPFLVESIGVMVGYFGAMLQRTEFAASREERKFLRRQQIRRLLGRWH